MATPKNVEIITYQVGFGDCFLLKFHYAHGRPRTMLIDFGSTRKESFSLLDIARQIKDDSEGKLDVVVATHRHKDHVHGFARKTTGGGPGDIIRSLAPTAVIQPWTEDPKAQRDAIRPTKKYGAQGPAFLAALSDMQSLAGNIEAYTKHLGFSGETELRRSLQVLGENNLGNKAAMKNLRSMGRRHYYAYHGMRLALARELPGIKIHVLGPPTLEQSDAIRTQRSRDDDEFWQLQAHASGFKSERGELFPDFTTSNRNPVWGRWLRRRLSKARAEHMLSIVRSLDHQMNNTSLILLIEVGDRRLLFPGDAQYESWMYALGKASVKRLLRDVDVYKVGHHGSLNATPKTMFGLFRKKRTHSSTGEPLLSLLSTKKGVHGNESSQTEVPRKTLVRSLRDETDLLSTTTLSTDEIAHVVTLPI